MTDNGNSQQPGSDAARVGDHGGRPVPLDQGHIEGTGGIPEHFANPGLPPHVHREADVDAKAAKRPSARSRRCSCISIAGHAAVHRGLLRDPRRTTAPTSPTSAPPRSRTSPSASRSAVSLFFIGIGAVHWAKTLMPDEEVVEERHAQRSSDADRARPPSTLSRRAARRPSSAAAR